MKKKSMIYDISADLEREFGAKGSATRKAAEDKAWEEYNAQILLDARHNAGLTQEDLATRMGVDKSYISRVEAWNNNTYSFHSLQTCSCNGVNCRAAPNDIEAYFPDATTPTNINLPLIHTPQSIGEGEMFLEQAKVHLH